MVTMNKRERLRAARHWPGMRRDADVFRDVLGGRPNIRAAYKSRGVAAGVLGATRDRYPNHRAMGFAGLGTARALAELKPRVVVP